jgi:lipid II:glycine glycyltransferase (peptidoglycan interpeptide bridge formation enzyme)
VVVSSGGEIAGGGQIIVKHFGPLGGVGYVARGPLLSPRYQGEADALLDEIETWARTNRVRHLIVQPSDNGGDIEAALSRRGYDQHAPEVTSTATFQIDLRQDVDQMLARMSRGRRRDILALQRGGLDVRIGSEADLDNFYAMHEATARRGRFTPISRTYLCRQWEHLYPTGWLQLFIAYHENRPIAGLWHTAFREVVTARLIGWTGDAAKLRPSIACYWGAIQWAKERGYRYYDFGGIDRAFAERVRASHCGVADPADSPDTFKYFFGGDLVLLPEPRQLTLNPIARAMTRPVFARLARSPTFRSFVSRLRNG